VYSAKAIFCYIFFQQHSHFVVYLNVSNHSLLKRRPKLSRKQSRSARHIVSTKTAIQSRAKEKLHLWCLCQVRNLLLMFLISRTRALNGTSHGSLNQITGVKSVELNFDLGYFSKWIAKRLRKAPSSERKLCVVSQVKLYHYHEP
jgi:hypothetical protein